MFSKSRVLSAVALACVVASSGASAELVSVDDGFSVYDTQTTNLWMNLRETAGLPLDTLFEEMEAGGEYDGWRLATPDEVFEMFSLNVEGYEENKASIKYLITPDFKEGWVSLFGGTENNVSAGFYLNGTAWSIAGVYRDGYPGPGQHAFFTESWGGNYSDEVGSGYDYYGHYLIYDEEFELNASPNVVPLPFLGMGLLGLLGVALGRKSKTA